MLLRRIRNREAAARAELRHLEPVLLPHLRSEVEYRIDRLPVRLQLEHRGAQVHVESHEF